MSLVKYNNNSLASVTDVSGTDGAMILIKTVTASSSGTVTFVNGDLPPHNFVVAAHPALSHPDLAFVGGESFGVTFDKAGDYEFQCEPHAGAGMKGVIHVQWGSLVN